MADGMAQRFIDALHTLERDRDVEPMAGLYADGAEVGNVVSPHEFTGPDGASEFWTRYRESFGEIESTFRNEIETEGRAALEWTSTGTTPEGGHFEYDGVTILEFDGDKVSRFRAFFNPALLGQQMEGAAR